MGLAACLAALYAFAASAVAIEIESFSASSSTSQAGAHADMRVSFAFATETAVGGPGSLGWSVVRGGAPRDVVVELPKGIVGNPQALAQCTLDELTVDTCPQEAQAGISHVGVIGFGSVFPLIPVGVYNMRPERGELAKFGFRVAAAMNSFISVRVRSEGDAGLTTTVTNIFSGMPLWAADLTIWGVPADTSHDAERICNGVLGCRAQSVPVPFMTNPAECGAPATATLRVRSWSHPDDWAVARSEPQQMDGCDRQVFEPKITVRPDTSERGVPTGLSVRIAVPQTYDTPNGLATPPLKDAVVTLPEGMSISPSSASGLQGCSDEQLGIGSAAPSSCPDGSKIGTVTLRTPLLTDVLTGGIYLGTQLSDDPESGRMFRISLELEAPERGLRLKLPGSIIVNGSTGQVTARFDDNPALPFSELELRFKGGDRGPLTMPVRCGVATTTASFVGWHRAPATQLSDQFVVTRNADGAPCPRGFAPSFTAGSVDAAAGRYTPLNVDFRRTDGDQELLAIDMLMPPGFSGAVPARELCSDAAAQVGTCPASTLVGDVMVGSGAGGSPFYLPGKAYMTNGYKGGAFGLSIVVPAKAGPFDLGTVVVRAAIFVDRTTAQLRIVSDPMPTMLKGVRLYVRDVRISMNRPGFTVNPTNCSPLRVAASITSSEGLLANVGSPFQVGDCAALPFRPSMSLRVGQRGRTQKDVTTPFSATLRMTPGQANNRSVKVTLPKPLNSRLRIVNQACTLEAYRADNCGARARIGQAIAVTPLLPDPLRGSAYFVRNPARRLPDIMVALKGQVEFDLTGKVSIPRDLTLSTNFDLVPDVPITMFRLDLVAGRNGPIGVVQNLCSARTRRALVARLEFRAQSGRLTQANQQMQVAGCGRASARGRTTPSRRGRNRAARGRRARARG